MSQITRCPSCTTTFKVVADQLRISDGWVRCGQCKEVFHGASHLQMAQAEPLLPDLPFDQWGAAEGERGGEGPPPPPPPKPQAGATGGVQVWGSARPRQGTSTFSSAGEGPVAAPSASASPSLTGDGKAFATPVTHTAVPAFLAASRPGIDGDLAPAWNLEPATRFGWRIREPAVVAPVSGSAEVAAAATVSALAERAPAHRDDWPDPAAPDSGGYELPFAELRDSGWPEDLEEDTALRSGTREPPEDKPGVQVVEAAEAPWAADPLDMIVGLEAQAVTDAGPAKSLETPSFGGAGLLRKAADGGGSPTHPHESPSGPAVPTEQAGYDEARKNEAIAPGADEEAATQEPGFIRVARRQAVWRRPAVRVLLTLGVLLLLAFLAMQVGMRERDRIAAVYPSSRPVLQAVCAAMGCTLAPVRSISDVVIDSSSFAKGRADTFLLNLALKNRAAMVVAMPAVELTLTDAQDQAVVRRVIRAEELGAPAVLAPRGDWTGSISLAVNADAARITGYRVLAFYP